MWLKTVIAGQGILVLIPLQAILNPSSIHLGVKTQASLCTQNHTGSSYLLNAEIMGICHHTGL